MTPRLVVAIDPGNCTGVACFIDEKLVLAYASSPAGRLILPASPFELPAHAIIELPKFYGQRAYDDPAQATGTANSLIREAVTLGRWVERLAARGIDCDEVAPSEWKGQVSKGGMNNRTLRALSDAERACIPELAASKIHNVLDAVGVGLWYLKRLGPGIGRGANRHSFKAV
jgi:hypothetical protein